MEKTKQIYHTFVRFCHCFLNSRGHRWRQRRFTPRFLLLLLLATRGRRWPIGKRERWRRITPALFGAVACRRRDGSASEVGVRRCGVATSALLLALLLRMLLGDWGWGRGVASTWAALGRGMMRGWRGSARWGTGAWRGAGYDAGSGATR